MRLRTDAASRAVIVACSLAAVSCAGNGTKITGLDGGGGQPFPPHLSAIQANVLTPVCSPSCHEPGGIAPFSMKTQADSFSNLVGVPNSEGASDALGNVFLRVAPGMPSKSYIILKLEGSPAILGSRMPLDKPPLEPETIATIAEWIRNGAADD